MLPMELKKGYVVEINGDFYEITEKEPFEYRTGEESTAIFSSVATAGESGFKNITEIEPDKNPMRLFYVKWGVKDGGRYFFKIPTGSSRFGTDVTKDIGFIDNEISPYHTPNEEYSFWLVHDYYPSINVKNNQAIAFTPKVYFKGTKYDIVPVKDSSKNSALRAGQIPYKHISLGGVRV
mgnify:CR=1 FL=1